MKPLKTFDISRFNAHRCGYKRTLLGYRSGTNARRQKTAYVGVIGSKRKVAVMKENLSKWRTSQELIDSIFAPMGLPIKAETPEEIAVSIMAEIIAVDNGANVRALRQPLEV